MLPQGTCIFPGVVTSRYKTFQNLEELLVIFDFIGPITKLVNA